jgi:DNA segregation ATPase FtsK/SpoIIIE, S-DNA-T family
MSRIAFHRPARLAPPRPPAEKIVLPAPPQARAQPGAALWTSLLLPLMSSVTMAAYLIAYRQAWLIAMAVGFVLVSVGITFLVRHQMRGEVAKAQRRLRERYFELLADARSRARAAAALRRLASAWTHPAPQRLWAIAARRRRVWERRAVDPDFLAVRFGVGRGPALMPVQVGPREDPMAEYDPGILAAARRLAAAAATVRPQAAVIDLARAGVVSLLGPAQRTRALARAVLCQIAVLRESRVSSAAREGNESIITRLVPGRGDWR